MVRVAETPQLSMWTTADPWEQKEKVEFCSGVRRSSVGSLASSRFFAECQDLFPSRETTNYKTKGPWPWDPLPKNPAWATTPLHVTRYWRPETACRKNLGAWVLFFKVVPGLKTFQPSAASSSA
jgi:hypothetical protein